MLLAKVDGILRPVASKVLPSSLFIKGYAHMRGLALKQYAKGLSGPVQAPLHSITVRGITFRNDLLNAAGLDKDGDLLNIHYFMGAGGAVVGTTLSRAHTGNQFAGLPNGQAWVPLPGCGGALNSLGLPSKGVDYACERIEEFKDRYKPDAFPIGLSVMEHPLDRKEGPHVAQEGVAYCVRRACESGVDFIEYNGSCPNVAHGSDEGLEKRLKDLARVRDEIDKDVLLIYKMGTFGDAAHTVRTLQNCGFDGVAGLNTQKPYVTLNNGCRDPDTDLDLHYIPDESDRAHFRYFTKNYGGGLSGPPIRKASFGAAQEMTRAMGSDFIFIHIGGIGSHKDMRESRALGIPLREWYTGLMNLLCEGVGQDEVYHRMVNQL